MFLGNETVTGNEVWLSGNDVRSHTLVLGDRDRRHQLLLGMAANALSWGSGLLWMSGTGDMAAYRDMQVLCAAYGRESDLLVLNFVPGGGSLAGTSLASMRLNPFGTGNAYMLASLMLSLAGVADEGMALWKGRAAAWLLGVMQVLCWRRDHLEQALDVSVVRAALSLSACVGLAMDERVPPEARSSLLAYLRSLPGFDRERGSRQSQTTMDQHGFLHMQVAGVLGCMAEVYGHVFASPVNDVDFVDVVLNRRVLVVLLPGLERSQEEIRMLGAIILGLLKAAMNEFLGTSIEACLDRDIPKPHRSRSPFLVVTDGSEVCTQDGMAVIASQARSLQLAMVYGADSAASFRQHRSSEGDAVLATIANRIRLLGDCACPSPLLDNLLPASALPASDGTAGLAVIEASGKQVVFSAFQPELPSCTRRADAGLPRQVAIRRCCRSGEATEEAGALDGRAR